MLNYTVVGKIGLLLDRTPVTFQDGKVVLGLPEHASLLVNGMEIPVLDSIAHIPQHVLHAVNTVRIKDRDGSRRAEGFLWDGRVATPMGYDTADVVHSLVTELASMVNRLSQAEENLKAIKAQVEIPLFP